MRVDLPIVVTANKDVRGRIRNYTARLGAVSEDFTTETGARDALATRLATVAHDVDLAHRRMWSLDGRELWTTAYDGGAWHYEIVRCAERHFATGPIIGRYPSREVCEDRMREHWYQANVDPIVRGICALVGWADYECPACHATIYTRDPGRCPGPACGREGLVPWRARKAA